MNAHIKIALVGIGAASSIAAISGLWFITLLASV